MYPSYSERFFKKTQKFTKEDQQLYNNHIIENFIDSVKEMNGTVLIPSKLKDLENPQSPGSEDLFEYYRMINTVKEDLFEPHLNEEVNNSVFTPKRKISKAFIQRKEDNKIPLKPALANIPMLNNNERKGSNPSSRGSSCSDLGSLGGTDSGDHSFGQNSAQLTDQFIHHLHSMYSILEHFTKAADYITEQYVTQVES